MVKDKSNVKKSKFGMLVLALVIIAALVLGGLIFLSLTVVSHYGTPIARPLNSK